MGYLRVRSNEICVVPRGIRFHVSLPAGPVRGFALELFEGHFELPELGPIGSTGLANIRDFEIPTASFDNSNVDTEIIAKFAGQVQRTVHRGSIFNVAGWSGTYYPFKYDLGMLISASTFSFKVTKSWDLGKFNTIGSVSYDHTVRSRCPQEQTKTGLLTRLGSVNPHSSHCPLICSR
jgi:homogentisate 1,2-dioxygenase